MTCLSDLRADISKFLTTSPPALDFVLPGVLAGTVCTFIAPGGMGKTMLTTQLACEMAMGLPLLMGTLDVPRTEPKKAVIFLAEESMAIMHHRVRAIAEELMRGNSKLHAAERKQLLLLLQDNFLLFPLAGHPERVSLEPGVSMSQEVLEVCSGARMVVFDPLRRFHSGNENAPEHLSAVVRQAEVVAHETGAAVILPHHASQQSIVSGTGDQVTAGRGTTALPDGARAQINLAPVDKDTAHDWQLQTKELDRYVKLTGSKANYSAKADTIVLQRNPKNGVLIPVPFEGTDSGSSRKKVQK